MITGLFTTRKFKPANKLHKYAILIAARNEDAVIGNLLESIKLQDYPQELITVFVVADNCTDRTAEVSAEHGAICYERFDSEHRTKGFALQYLVKCIERDYGTDTYEGYFIFDADNLLKSDFVSRMNDSFDSGEKIITSYRNTKNFGDNWISASYGIHWLRTSRAEHRARSFFRLATRIQGTGFLFSSELIKDGWNYTSLTEDRAFCADAVVNGYRISYNHDAEFFDEQPTDIHTAMRQRIRWAKGHLQAFLETSFKLFANIFVRKKQRGEKKESAKGSLSDNLISRFASYDMLSIVFPHSLACFLRDIVLFSLNLVLIICSANYFGIHLAPGILGRIFEFFNIQISVQKTYSTIILFILFSIFGFIISYLSKTLVGIYIFFIERKRIPPIKWYKKLWFCFMFPLFDIIGKISSLLALFKHVEWKPIRHNAEISISEIEKSLQTK
jgi:cellulose synthase/poly-beta-1,6-N-acetylglucosamine synthase-like glycosyltransferase